MSAWDYECVGCREDNGQPVLGNDPPGMCFDHGGCLADCGHPAKPDADYCGGEDCALVDALESA